MTDQDVYGKALGKKFRAVRGSMCAPDADPAESAETAATYICRELRRDVKDLAERCAAAVRQLDYSASLFAADELQERADREAAQSLGAQHIAEAVRRTREDNGSAVDFFRHLAEQAVQTTSARLATQTDYRGDDEFKDAFTASEPRTVDACVRVLASPCGFEHSGVAASAAGGPADLLEIVVARRPE
ncbi:MAG: hypothetical protein WAN59_12735 [Candidatus Baltobacteraceae bacterium]